MATEQLITLLENSN